MTAPTELIELIREQRSVFIKTENYVPAHINATEGHKIADDWDEDRLRDYLYGEAALNKGRPHNGSVSIFIGEAKYHTWVRHYLVREVRQGTDWTYEWERVL